MTASIFLQWTLKQFAAGRNWQPRWLITSKICVVSALLFSPPHSLRGNSFQSDLSFFLSTSLSLSVCLSISLSVCIATMQAYRCHCVQTHLFWLAHQIWRKHGAYVAIQQYCFRFSVSLRISNDDAFSCHFVRRSSWSPKISESERCQMFPFVRHSGTYWEKRHSRISVGYRYSRDAGEQILDQTGTLWLKAEQSLPFSRQREHNNNNNNNKFLCVWGLPGVMVTPTHFLPIFFQTPRDPWYRGFR